MPYPARINDFMPYCPYTLKPEIELDLLMIGFSSSPEELALVITAINVLLIKNALPGSETNRRSGIDRSLLS